MSYSELLRLPPLASSGESHSLLSATNLDLTATQHAFEQGKQAYAIQNYNQAVACYTRALNSLQSDLESVILLHRATAWEKQNNHQQTVEDAKLANPTDSLTRPDPYFVLANALFFQTKLIEATRTYQKGLELVPDKYANERNILADKFQQLTALIPLRNQWMIQLLPFEVLSRILLYMNVQTRGRLALTCKFWYDLILHQWPAMCHTINIIDIKNANPFLAAIPPGVPKRIRLDSYTKSLGLSGFVSERAMKTVCAQGWNALEAIEIGEGSPQLLEVLERNKNTLTSLTLHSWTDQRNDIEPADLLAAAIGACPNLQFVTQSFDQYHSNRRSGPFPTVLTDIWFSNLHLTAVSISEWTCGDRSLIPLLKRTPCLISLRMRNRCGHVDFKKVLRAVNEICPSLQEFSYTNKPAIHEDQQKTTVSYTRPTSSSFQLRSLYQTRGIRKISIQNSVDHRPYKPLFYEDEELRLMFLNCHHSLEVLELDHIVPQSDTQYSSSYELGRFGAPQLHYDEEFWSLRELGRLGAPQLQTLVLKFEKGVPLSSETISSLIAVCPSLQVVNIEGTGFWHRRIFDALAGTVHLRKLSIVETHYHHVSDRLRQIDGLRIGGIGQEIEADGIIHSELWLLPVFQKAHGLVDFTFGVYGDHSATELVSKLAPYIAASNIRSLDLLTTPIRTTGELKTILNSLSSSQALRSMYIALSCYVTDTDIAAFVTIHNLTYLRIRNFTSKEIQGYMLDTLFQQLQKRDRFAMAYISNHAIPDEVTPVIVKCHTHGSAVSGLNRNNNILRNNFEVEELYIKSGRKWIGQ